MWMRLGRWMSLAVGPFVGSDHGTGVEYAFKARALRWPVDTVHIGVADQVT